MFYYQYRRLYQLHLSKYRACMDIRVIYKITIQNCRLDICDHFLLNIYTAVFLKSDPRLSLNCYLVYVARP